MRLDYCRFGAPWRKRTAFFTNINGLEGVKCFCTGGHEHQVLRGASPSGVMWTKVAEPYPHHVADLLATAISHAAGWEESCDVVDVCAFSARASSELM